MSEDGPLAGRARRQAGGCALRPRLVRVPPFVACCFEPAGTRKKTGRAPKHPPPAAPSSHHHGTPWGSGRYPFPPNASVEGAFPGCRLGACTGDRHVIALDNYTCTLYEVTRWPTSIAILQ